MTDRFFIAAGDLQISNKMLGRGGFGIVYPAVTVSTKKHVAVKKIMFDDNTWSKWYDQIKKEESLMRHAEVMQASSEKSNFFYNRMVRHPHIVEYIGYNENEPDREFWIVMELMDGTLQSYCNGQKSMEDFCKYDIGVQCWSALYYLHDRVKVAHKDIKPDNVLLKKLANDKILAKLSDFGLSEVKEAIDKTMTTSRGAGSIAYTAPEVYAKSKRNPQQADVYSMGVTLTELFAGQPFWPPTTMIEHQLATWCNLACAVSDNENTHAVDTIPGHIVTAMSSWPERVKLCLTAAIAIKRNSRPSAASALKMFTATDSGYWEMKLVANKLRLCKFDANAELVGELTKENFAQWSLLKPDSAVCSFIALHCGIREQEIIRMATNFGMVKKYILPYLKMFTIKGGEVPLTIDYVTFCPVLEVLCLDETPINAFFASLNTLSATLKIIALNGELSHGNVLSFLAQWCPNLLHFSTASTLLNDTTFRKFCDSCTALEYMCFRVSESMLSKCDSFWKLPLTSLVLTIGENKTPDGDILRMITSNFKNLTSLTFALEGMLSDYDVFPLRNLTQLQTLELYSKNLVRLSLGISSIVKGGNIKALGLQNIEIGDECFSDCHNFLTLLELFTAEVDVTPQKAVEMVQVLEKHQMLEKIQLDIQGSVYSFPKDGVRKDYAKHVCDQIETAAKSRSVVQVMYGYPSITEFETYDLKLWESYFSSLLM